MYVMLYAAMLREGLFFSEVKRSKESSSEMLLISDILYKLMVCVGLIVS